MGIAAKEGDLAIRAYTTRFAGTQPDALCAAMSGEYGVTCRIVRCMEIAELRGYEPLIALVKYAFLVDHYVAVLSVTDTEVTLGDPLTGTRECTREEFEQAWRHYVILIEQDPRS